MRAAQGPLEPREASVHVPGADSRAAWARQPELRGQGRALPSQGSWPSHLTLEPRCDLLYCSQLEKGLLTGPIHKETT